MSPPGEGPGTGDALPMPPRWPLLVVVLVGVVGTAAAISSAGIRAGDAVQLVGEAILAAVVAGGAAWLILGALRLRSIAIQLALATLAPVASVAIGVWWAASGMFIMSHDLSVLAVVLIVSGTAGFVAALLLGRRVAAATRRIEALARRLGDEPDDPDGRQPENLAGESGSIRVRGPVELSALSDELHATAGRLRAARAESEALDRSRRELVAWVSHDLRTPLAGVRAMAEALEDGIVEDAATVARYHRTMRQEVERLAGLVDDLFELSRIQSGMFDLDVQPVALDELLTEAAAGASIAASAKGVELRGPGHRAPVVSLSTAEMSRVVRNLLDNAIRHTPPGGSVEVGAASGPDGPVLWVEDACGGIPADVAERVFDAAYRGDDARTPGDGRAGLGLAVARGLVEAHGARIAVTNAGDGCRFTVTFPAEAAASEESTDRVSPRS